MVAIGNAAGGVQQYGLDPVVGEARQQYPARIGLVQFGQVGFSPGKTHPRRAIQALQGKGRIRP